MPEHLSELHTLPPYLPSQSDVACVLIALQTNAAKAMRHVPTHSACSAWQSLWGHVSAKQGAVSSNRRWSLTTSTCNMCSFPHSKIKIDRKNSSTYTAAWQHEFYSPRDPSRVRSWALLRSPSVLIRWANAWCDVQSVQSLRAGNESKVKTSCCLPFSGEL